MDDEAPKFPGTMELHVRLGDEGGGRLLKVTVRSADRPGGEDEEDQGAEELRRRARDVMPVFVAAVDAGLFRGPTEDQHAQVLNATARMGERERIDEWEIMTPPIEGFALTVLARMFWVAEARSVSVTQNAPGARLTVLALADGGPPTPRAVPWKVDMHIEDEVKNGVVLVCFQADPPPEVVRATHATLRAWAAVAAFGGFSGGASAPASAALVSELGTELAREVFATFEALVVGRDGWSALWEGLSVVHRAAPIQRIEIR